MPRMKKTPGNVLSSLLKKYDLNYNRLAKAIGLSSAMIRLIARDEGPISASVAHRLAKFFKTKPEFWLNLQLDFDCSRAAEDKKLSKALENITTVDKATFERKPRAKKQGSIKAAKSTLKRKGRPAKAAASKAAATKKPAKKAPAKKAAVKKATAGKRGRPATKVAASKVSAKASANAGAKGAKLQKKTAGKTAVKKAPAVKRGKLAAKAAAAKKVAARPAVTVKKTLPAAKPAAEQKPTVVQSAPLPQPQARPAYNPDPVINEPEI